jgi:hypothetical protein
MIIILIAVRARANENHSHLGFEAKKAALYWRLVVI